MNKHLTDLLIVFFSMWLIILGFTLWSGSNGYDFLYQFTGRKEYFILAHYTNVLGWIANLTGFISLCIKFYEYLELNNQIRRIKNYVY